MEEDVSCDSEFRLWLARNNLELQYGGGSNLESMAIILLRNFSRNFSVHLEFGENFMTYFHDWLSYIMSILHDEAKTTSFLTELNLITRSEASSLEECAWKLLPLFTKFFSKYTFSVDDGIELQGQNNSSTIGITVEGIRNGGAKETLQVVSFSNEANDKPVMAALTPRGILYTFPEMYLTLLKDLEKYNLMDRYFRKWMRRFDENPAGFSKADFFKEYQDKLKQTSMGKSSKDMLKTVFHGSGNGKLFPLEHLTNLEAENANEEVLLKSLIYFLKDSVGKSLNFCVTHSIVSKNENYVKEANKFKRMKLQLDQEIKELHDELLQDAARQGFLRWLQFKKELFGIKLDYLSVISLDFDTVFDSPHTVCSVVDLLVKEFKMKPFKEMRDFIEKNDEKAFDEIKAFLYGLLGGMTISPNDENPRILEIKGYNIIMSKAIQMLTSVQMVKKPKRAQENSEEVNQPRETEKRVPGSGIKRFRKFIHLLINLNNLSKTPLSYCDEVHFISPGTVYLDKSLDSGHWHSKNVVIIANQLDVTKEVKIDTSGEHGISYFSDKAPKNPVSGGTGPDGMHGPNGKGAGNIHIYSEMEVTGLGKLTLSANGGNGGRGQSGGDGGNGKPGKIGADAEMPEYAYWCRWMLNPGEEGSSGGSGGRGGKAGLGGLGGKQGEVCLFSKNDELRSGYQRNCEDGSNGDNGLVGVGGAPGKGGRDGVDKGWATETMPFKDSQESSGKLKLVEIVGWVYVGYQLKNDTRHDFQKKSGEKGTDGTTPETLNRQVEAVKGINLSQVKKLATSLGIGMNLDATEEIQGEIEGLNSGKQEKLDKIKSLTADRIEKEALEEEWMEKSRQQLELLERVDQDYSEFQKTIQAEQNVTVNLSLQTKSDAPAPSSRKISENFFKYDDGYFETKEIPIQNDSLRKCIEELNVVASSSHGDVYQQLEICLASLMANHPGQIAKLKKSFVWVCQKFQKKGAPEFYGFEGGKYLAEFLPGDLYASFLIEGNGQLKGKFEEFSSTKDESIANKTKKVFKGVSNKIFTKVGIFEQLYHLRKNKASDALLDRIETSFKAEESTNDVLSNTMRSVYKFQVIGRALEECEQMLLPNQDKTTEEYLKTLKHVVKILEEIYAICEEVELFHPKGGVRKFLTKFIADAPLTGLSPGAIQNAIKVVYNLSFGNICRKIKELAKEEGLLRKYTQLLRKFPLPPAELDQLENCVDLSSSPGAREVVTDYIRTVYDELKKSATSPWHSGSSGKLRKFDIIAQEIENMVQGEFTYAEEMDIYRKIGEIHLGSGAFGLPEAKIEKIRVYFEKIQTQRRAAGHSHRSKEKKMENYFLQKFEIHSQILSQIADLFFTNLEICQEIPQASYVVKYFKWRLKKLELVLLATAGGDLLRAQWRKIIIMDNPEEILKCIGKFVFDSSKETDFLKILLSEARHIDPEEIDSLCKISERQEFFQGLIKLCMKTLKAGKQDTVAEKFYGIVALGLTTFYENSQLMKYFEVDLVESHFTFKDVGGEQICAFIENQLEDFKHSTLFKLAEPLAPRAEANDLSLQVNLENYFEAECHRCRKPLPEQLLKFKGRLSNCIQNAQKTGNEEIVSKLYLEIENSIEKYGFYLNTLASSMESFQVRQFRSSLDEKLNIEIKGQAEEIQQAIMNLFATPAEFLKLMQVPTWDRSQCLNKYQLEVLFKHVTELLGIEAKRKSNENLEQLVWFDGLKLLIFESGLRLIDLPFSLEIYLAFSPITNISFQKEVNSEEFVSKLATGAILNGTKRNFYIRVFRTFVKNGLTNPFEKQQIFEDSFPFETIVYKNFLLLLTDDEKRIWNNFQTSKSKIEYRAHFKEILYKEIGKSGEFIQTKIFQNVKVNLLEIYGLRDTTVPVEAVLRKLTFFAEIDQFVQEWLAFLKNTVEQLSNNKMLSLEELFQFLDAALQCRGENSCWVETLSKIASSHLQFNWLKQIHISAIYCHFDDILESNPTKSEVFETFNSIKKLVKKKNPAIFEREFYKVVSEKLLEYLKIKNKPAREEILEIFKSIRDHFVPAQVKLLENMRNFELSSWPNFLPHFGFISKGFPTDTLNKILSMDGIPEASRHRLIDIYDNKFPITKSKNMTDFGKAISRIYSMDLSIDQLLRKLEDDMGLMRNTSDFLRAIEDHIKALTTIKEYKNDDLFTQVFGDQLNIHIKPAEREKLKQLIQGWTDALNGPSRIFSNNGKVIRTWDGNDIKKWLKIRSLGKYVAPLVNVAKLGLEATGLIQNTEERKRTDEELALENEMVQIEMLAVISRGVKLASALKEKKQLNEELKKDPSNNQLKLKVEDKEKKLGYYPRQTQILAVILFLRSKNGRLGEISTGEGKTCICALLAIMWALDNKNVNIISSSTVLAIANQDEWIGLFELFEIQFGNNCKDVASASSSQLKERYRKLVIFGDLGSFQTHILKTVYFGDDITAGRVPDYVIVDEVDSMLLDKASHMLYISHPIPEFKYVRGIFLRIWQLIQNNEGNDNAYAILEQIQNEIGADLKFPGSIRTFVESRLLIWIKNAYEAMNMAEGVNYISKDNNKEEGKACVVDNLTGVEEPNMQYSYGLQQALQMKHFNRMSQETLKAYFSSNFEYFDKLRGNIFGFTGTLGSEKDRELIRANYGVDFFRLPRHRFRYCVQYPPVIEQTEEKWLSSLVDVVQEMIKERSILVVTENILSANLISDHLSRSISSSPLRGEVENIEVAVYKSSFDEDFKKRVLEAELGPGKVIVATNIGGRGTDIKLSEKLKENGGLHVILAYLPDNLRVELQAFGRAARADNKGSFQFVLNTGIENVDIFWLKKMRDWNDSKRLNEIIDKELPKIKLQQMLLEKYWEFFCDVQMNVFNSKKNCEHKMQLNFLNNRWALWLDQVQKDIDRLHLVGGDTVAILQKFEKFRNDMQILADNRSFEYTLFEKIKLAKSLQETGDTTGTSRSRNILKEVIGEELEFNEMAHLYKAAVEINQKKVTIKERKEAKDHLKIAKRAILRRQEQLYTSLLMNELKDVDSATVNSASAKSKEETKFKIQIKNELAILEKFDAAVVEMTGFELSPEIIQKVPGVYDEKEAKELIQELSNLELLTGPKLKKGIKFINEEGSTVYQIQLDCDTTVKFSWNYFHIAQPLFHLLQEKVDSNDRFICSEDLEKVLMSQDDIWNTIRKALFSLPNAPHPPEGSSEVEQGNVEPKLKTKLSKELILSFEEKLQDGSRCYKYCERRLRRWHNNDENSTLLQQQEELVKEELQVLSNSRYLVESCQVVLFDKDVYNNIEFPEEFRVPLACYLNGEFCKEQIYSKEKRDDLEKFLSDTLELSDEKKKDIKWDELFINIEVLLEKNGILQESEIISNVGEQSYFSSELPNDAKLTMLKDLVKDGHTLESVKSRVNELRGRIFDFENLEDMLKDEDENFVPIETILENAGIKVNELGILQRKFPHLAPMLIPLFQTHQSVINPIIYKHKIPLGKDTKLCSSQLFKYLEDEGVIKKYRLKFPYKGSADEVDAQIKCIQEKINKSTKIQNIFDSFHSTHAEKRNERLNEIKEDFINKDKTNIFTFVHSSWTAVRDLKKEREKYANELKQYREAISTFVLSSAGTVKVIAKPDLKYKSLAGEFSNGQALLHELIEYAEEGADVIPYLAMRKERFPIGACIAIGIGVGQIAIGLIITCASGGLASPAALILMSDGMSDIIYAAYSGYKGDFSWGGYATNKAISLSINCATLGTGSAVSFVGNVTGATGTALFIEGAKQCGKFLAFQAAQQAFAAVSDDVLTYVLDWIRNKLLGTFKTAFIELLEKESEKEESEIGIRLRRLDENLINLYNSSSNTRHFQNRMEEFEGMFKAEDRTSLSIGLQRMAVVISGYLATVSQTVFEKTLSSSNMQLNCVLTLLKAAKAFMSCSQPHTDKEFYTRKATVFICESLEEANNFFQDVAQTLLKEKSKHRVSVETKMSKEEFEVVKEDYMRNLKVKLLDNTLMYIQKQLLEPALKLNTQVMLREIVSKMSQRNYDSFRRSVTDSSEKIRRNLLNKEKTKVENATVVTSFGDQLSKDADTEMPPSSKTVINFIGKDVGDLRKLYGNRVDFYEDKYGDVYAQVSN